MKIVALVGALVVGVALAGCRHEVDHKRVAAYSDPEFGWTVAVPENFHVARAKRCVFHCVAGTVFASFRLGADPLDRLQQPPPDGVALWLGYGTYTVPNLSQREARFPLELADFRPTVRPSRQVTVRRLVFSANGHALEARALVGLDAPARDRAALARLVASLRFPPVEEGTVTAEVFYVLGRPGRYPVGSATRYGQRELPRARLLWPQTFFLVHAPGGFYAIGHTANLVGGFRACPVQLDRRRFQFFCQDGARWDRLGRVLANPDPDLLRDDPLRLFTTMIGQDGHILVSRASYSSATPELARRLWPTG